MLGTSNNPHPSAMSPTRKQELRRYTFALGATFIGAYLTEPTGSLLPLALGASALLLSTWTLAKALWVRGGRR